MIESGLKVQQILHELKEINIQTKKTAQVAAVFKSLIKRLSKRKC